METITFLKGLEAHVHMRDGDILKTVGPMTARQFWGAIIEPNLSPPITTGEQGRSYLERVRAACGSDFRPYLLCYLTDTLDPQGLYESLCDGTFIGAKFYPNGATTNSDSGIVDVTTLYTPGTNQYECLRAIAAADKVLQLHCELNFQLDGYELDPYDKERYFFDEIMPRLQEAHPKLKISCEHLTSREGGDYLLQYGGPLLGCSITAHHLLCDRRDMFRGGLHPHLYCLPAIKRDEHRKALELLATGGYSFVWAGTDSAPHDRMKKECDCCSGGVFTAHAAVEFYAEVFDRVHALGDRFEAFMSINGPRFYGLEPGRDQITLARDPWTVDSLISYSDEPQDVIVPHGYDADPEKRIKLTWKLI